MGALEPREAAVGVSAEHLLAAKELHSQKGEHNDEQEEQKQQADDGLHGVEKGDHQVPERRPVPANRGRWGWGVWLGPPAGWRRPVLALPPPPSGCQGIPRTYFVTLKIRNNLRARNTLIPKDVPGFMTAQMTSKMLPIIT